MQLARLRLPKGDTSIRRPLMQVSESLSMVCTRSYLPHGFAECTIVTLSAVLDAAAASDHVSAESDRRGAVHIR